MKSNLITKVISDPAIGEYVIIIDYNCNVVTSYVNANLFQYKFNKDDIINELLIVAPAISLDDFIISMLESGEYENYFEDIPITE